MKELAKQWAFNEDNVSPAATLKNFPKTKPVYQGMGAFFRKYSVIT